MPQKVDPFIPIPKKPSLPQGQYGMRWLRKPEARIQESSKQAHSRSLDITRQIPYQNLNTVKPRTLQPFIKTPPTNPVVPRVITPARTPGASTQTFPLDKASPQALSTQPPLLESVASSKKQPTIPPTTMRPTVGKTVAPARNVRRLSKFAVPLMVITGIGLGLALQILIVGEIVIAIYAVYSLVCRVTSRTTFLLSLMILLVVVVLFITHGNDTLRQNFAVYAFLLLVVGSVSLAFETRRSGHEKSTQA